MLSRRNDNSQLANLRRNRVIPYSVPVGVLAAGAGAVQRYLGNSFGVSGGNGSHKKKNSKKRPRSEISNKSQLSSNSAAAPVKKLTGRKKTKSKSIRKSQKTSKSLRKTIDRKIKTGPKILMHSKDGNILFQLTSGVNKVEWDQSFYLPTSTVLKARLNYKQVGQDNASANRIEEIDADVGGYVGKKFFMKDTADLRFKNNSNAPAEITVYLVKCMNYTNFGPLSDLTESRKAAFGDASVLDYTDDFNQYWSVPRVSGNQRKWKIHKHWKLHLNGGQDGRVYVKIPQYTFDPTLAFEMSDTTYYKGTYAIIFRSMGVVSHDTASTGLLGISNTIVDCRAVVNEKTYMRNSMVVKAVRQLANQGVASPDIVPVVSDPMFPGVGVVDAQ